MGTFIHSPDDQIIIDDLVMPLSFFVTQEAAYTLASPYTNREYVQSSHNFLYDGTNQYSESLPWTDGDTYISNKATYSAAYDSYLNPAPNLADAKTQQKELVDIYGVTKKDGKVTYGAVNYPSVHGRLHRELYYWARKGKVDATHYLLDEDDNKVVLTQFELVQIANLMDDLYFECDKVADDHKIAIDALTTVNDVLNYDYTTGWPTVPYTG